MKQWSLDLKNPLNTFIHAKHADSNSDMVKCVKKIYQNPYLRQFANTKFFPKKIKIINQSGFILGKNSFDREINWVAALIAANSEQLNSFVNLEELYDKYILTSQFNKALEVIGRIEENFGFSHWSIEQRINLIELLEGTDSQRSFTNKLSDTPDIHPQLRVFIVFAGWRAEKNNSYRLFNYNFQRLNLGGWKDYYWFKLNYFTDISYDNLEKMLLFEFDSSLIDIYNMYIKLCQYIVSISTPELLESVKQSLRYQDNIIDQRIINLRALLLDSFDKPIPSTNSIQILDEYTKGNYTNVTKLVFDEFNSGRVYIDYLELLARANLKTNSRCQDSTKILYNKLIVLIETIIARDENYQDAKDELFKLVSLFQNQLWSARLYSFLISEQSSYSYNDKKARIGFLNTFIGNPRQFYYLNNAEISIRFFKKMEDVFPKSITIQLYKMLLQLNDDQNNNIKLLGLPEDRRNKYLAEYNMNYGNPEVAISLYQLLLVNDDPISYQDALDGLLKCYLLMKDYKECIKLITKCVVKNLNYLDGTPIIDVLNELESIRKHGLWGNIEFSITYDAYSKIYGSNKNMIIAVSCGKFLKANGFNRPSEIEEGLFNKDLLIYFLRNVCIVNILDSCNEYNSSEEVEKERILVCQKLSLLDPQNANIYSEEIKQITQKIVIRQHIRKIDDSKIYVDIDEIKSNIIKNLHESYDRFRSLKGYELNLDNLIFKLKEAMPEMDFRILNDEKFELFKTMYFEIRNQFTATEYGLDNCLSIGIRHGVLSASFRKPLENANLITVKDATTDKYSDNEYWVNKLDTLEDTELQKIIEYLNDFSKSVDELIETLRTKWIQIKTENRNQEGLFDFIMSNSELKILQNKSAEATTFEEFCDIVINNLWEVTDRCLSIIRSRIDSDFKSQFINLFDKLHTRLSNLDVERTILTELFNSITKAKTDFQYDFKRVSKWFERSSESKVADFEMTLPINIGIEIINNIHPKQKLKSIIRSESIFLRGSTLRSLVDVVFIFFENVIKHSGLSSEELEITVDFANHDEQLVLLVENGINKDIDWKNQINKLNLIKSYVNDGVSLDKAKSEGGSGYYKVAKIMKYDLNVVII